MIFTLFALCRLAVSVAGMSRVILVHMSSEEDTRRIKVSTDYSRSYGELEKAIAEQIPDIETTKIEFYSNSESQFLSHDPAELVQSRFLTCYVTAPQSANKPIARIRGRAFNIDKGFSICGRAIQIHDGSERSLGTGLNTWDGAVVLAKYLEANPHLVAGKRVLELGSGTGLAGIAAAMLGAEVSVLTDLEYTMENLRLNIRNNLNGTEAADRVYARALDWGDPKAYIFPKDIMSNCDSSSESTLSESPSSRGENWDVILGADVVWVEELVPLLVQALTALSGTETVFLLSHQVTTPSSTAYMSVGFLHTH